MFVSRGKRRKLFGVVILGKGVALFARSNAIDAEIIKGRNSSNMWFEPTDLLKAPQAFRTELWKTLDFVSPNFNELKEMVNCALRGTGTFSAPERDEISRYSAKKEVVTADSDKRISEDLGGYVEAGLCDDETLVQSSAKLGTALVLQGIRTVLVTLGRCGIVVVRRGGADDHLFKNGRRIPRETETGVDIQARLYRVTPLNDIVNVSGAGDCWAAGFIAAALRGLPEKMCIESAVAAANCSLRHWEAVPINLPVSLPESDAAARALSGYINIAIPSRN